MMFVAAAYGAFSAISFIAYAWDKSLARRGGQRISEYWLHLFSLLGGWPGALVAQQLFRHKTVKKDFRTVFWTTVLVNVAFVTWLLSPWSAGFPAGSN